MSDVNKVDPYVIYSRLNVMLEDLERTNRNAISDGVYVDQQIKDVINRVNTTKQFIFDSFALWDKQNARHLFNSPAYLQVMDVKNKMFELLLYIDNFMRVLSTSVDSLRDYFARSEDLHAPLAVEMERLFMENQSLKVLMAFSDNRRINKQENKITVQANLDNTNEVVIPPEVNGTSMGVKSNGMRRKKY